MTRFVSIVLLLLSLSGLATAKENLIDCRVIVGGMRECIPYSSKLLKAKEIKYQESKKKLIVDKILPVPQKPLHLKVIPVEEMIERYVKVEDSKRFKGTEEYFDVSEYYRKKRLEAAKKEKALVTEEQNATVMQGKPSVPTYGTYTVQKGDTLSKIALMFGMKSKEVMQLNEIKQKDRLKIGQKLQVPFSQEMINAISSARYTVKEGDTLIDIAKKFNLDPKELVLYNQVKSTIQISPGSVLKLPLSYVKAAEKAKKRRAKRLAEAKKERQTYSAKFIRSIAKHRLRVTATAYTSHSKQTDKTPFIAAWNNRLRPGMKVIAVSRDLLYKYGMKNGTKVKIAGLPGFYRVRDKMNKRYKRRIDIYMGTNRRKALKWGRRSVVIYW